MDAVRVVGAAALGGLVTAVALALTGVLSGAGTPAVGAPTGQGVAAVHRQAAPAVVGVEVPGRSGSGFIFDADGHVLTSAHVVNGAPEAVVTVGSRRLPAKVRGVEPSVDVAVLALDAPPAGVVPLSFGESAAVRVGDPVVAIGSPFGLRDSVSTGIVSGLRRQIDSPNGFAITGVIQTDAALNPGNSGGPLLDMSGRVIGIATQIATDSGRNEGIGFAVPAATARRAAMAIVRTGAADLPYLGVVGQDVGDGVRIAQATPSGPAAGILRPGDVLVAVDGESVRDNGDLATVLAGRSPGQAVDLEVLREGGRTRVTVTLAVRPEAGP